MVSITIIVFNYTYIDSVWLFMNDIVILICKMENIEFQIKFTPFKLIYTHKKTEIYHVIQMYHGLKLMLMFINIGMCVELSHGM